MRRLLCLIQLVFIALGVSAAKDAPSPLKPTLSSDGVFEVYAIPKSVDGNVNGASFYYGQKLYLRLRGSDKEGVLLRENDLWLDVKWAPHSHLLGVEDHWDDNSSAVYVYAISLAPGSGQPQFKLVFQSPGNVNNIQWSIEEWGPHLRTLKLRCDVQRSRTDLAGNPVITQNDGAYTVHRTYSIGSRAVPGKE